jgi:plasmid stabilization system protein ParE
MIVQEFYFTERARDSFRDVVAQLQQVSLIAAERVRNKIFHKLHLIHHHPLQGSKKIELTIDGHFRVATVLDYKIYYLVDHDRIMVLEILQDKNLKQDKG